MQSFTRNYKFMPEKTAQLHEFAAKLKEENPAWVGDIKDFCDEVTITVPRESIVDVCWVLKTKHDFDLLADLCGADRGPEEEPRS